MLFQIFQVQCNLLMFQKILYQRVQIKILNTVRQQFYPIILNTNNSISYRLQISEDYDVWIQVQNFPLKFKIRTLQILTLNKHHKMSYFYFSQGFNFMPVFYSPALENAYHLGYCGDQKIQNLSYLQTQQSSLPLNVPEQISFPQVDLEQKNTFQNIIQDIDQKKRKTKKKRGVDKQKELQSAKKNSESNIINQFFSFFSCRVQSQEIVEKAIIASVHKIEELQKVISIFYNIMKCMSMQRIKKYVNKKTLLNIFGKENIEKQIPQILQKFEAISFINIDEICEIIRRCCLYFLRNPSLISILASKRISTISKRQHLKKRRLLCNIVTGKL